MREREYGERKEKEGGEVARMGGVSFSTKKRMGMLSCGRTGTNGYRQKRGTQETDEGGRENGKKRSM